MAPDEASCKNYCHQQKTDISKKGGLTLAGLYFSFLHSWGLLCTCHFSLSGGTYLRTCERQKAIIKDR